MVKNQKLLQQAKAKDAVLKQKLWLCEETQWWSYLPEKQNDRTADNEWLFVETYPFGSSAPSYSS